MDDREAIGPQYGGDSPFTARMRLHQSWYRAAVLGARWAMTVHRDGGVAVIDGPALMVEGFTEITSMYRRY